MSTVTHSQSRALVQEVVSGVLDGLLTSRLLNELAVERQDKNAVKEERGARHETVISFVGGQGRVTWNIFLVNDFGCSLTSYVTMDLNTNGRWTQTLGGDSQKSGRDCSVPALISALSFALQAIQPSREAFQPHSTLDALQGPCIS